MAGLCEKALVNHIRSDIIYSKTQYFIFDMI